MLKDTIQSDLKAAMLSGDKQRSSVLNMLKGAVLNQEIASGRRDTGLGDEAVLGVLQKEAKKRLDAATLYQNAGDKEREAAERYEHDIISTYLPKQMSDDELSSIVDGQITKLQPSGMQDMGKVIGAVKAETEGKADGSRIATIVKEKISQ